MVTRIRNPAFFGKIMLYILPAISIPDNCLNAQDPVHTVFYRVYFRDKGVNDVTGFTLTDLFSPRASERREKAGNTSPDFTDLPVWKGYTEEISLLGFRLHSVSRWMNSALFKATGVTGTDILLSLPFVADVRIVKEVSAKNIHHDKLRPVAGQSDLPPYDNPVSMLYGQNIHDSGFDGRGILIAVLDAGFTDADRISSLSNLRSRKGVKATYDFVKNSEFVYDYHYHGTAVLSVLSGEIPGSIAGSAPGAGYLLLRTEDPETEYPAEEDYWVAGAEFADSLGADIINSSLGYYWFDDPVYNYKYADMDGNSTFITQAADIAASKGILVVNSAGNERNSDWQRIIAPADGDNVLAVGAVDGNMFISSFSSAGPSWDNRIKPDVAAQGVSVPVQTTLTGVSRANGTSFSCPVISGMCACVMQAVPRATNHDIINALHSSSDRFLNPDSLYGYGIPDMVRVINNLQEKYVTRPVNKSAAGPNPFTDNLNIILDEIPHRLKIEIFSSSGRLILRKDFRNYIGRSISIDEMQNFKQGLYIIRLTTENGVFTHKVIKTGN